jgi:iron complex transport system substrate-binding protein
VSVRRALLPLVALALAGCPDGGPKQVADPDAGATTPSAVATRTLATREARRPSVVTAAPALAEIVCALGGLPHLAGVSRYCVHPPALKDLPQIGGAIDPNLEAIDALSPDLIFVQARDERLEELAQVRGYRVEAFRIETVRQALEATTRVGELLGRQDAARAEVMRLEAAFARARAEAPARRPRTLVVFGHRPGDLAQVSAPGATTFIADCLRAAGGESCLEDLPGDAWHVLSLEAILERRPELIIELATDPVDEATARALRADWAVLEGVPAVAQGKVAIVSGTEVLIPGPRLDRLLAKLARAVRGELDVGDPR